MAKRIPSDAKIVVVNPDGSRHIAPAANEAVLKGYNSKLDPEKQQKFYPFVEGKPLSEYGKGVKTGVNPEKDSLALVEKMVSKLDAQEEEIKKLKEQLAKKSEGESFTDIKSKAAKKTK